MNLILTIIVYGGFGAMMNFCDLWFTDWQYWVLFIFLLGAEHLGSVKNR